MSEDSFSKTLAYFTRAVEKTTSARFAAAKRLESRQRQSSYVVSLLSLFVIALSLIPNVLDLHQYQNQILLGCSIVLSVFVIFASLIDGSRDYNRRSEMLHDCARKTARIMHTLRRIEVAGRLDAASEELKNLQDEYQKVLDGCPINHDDVDYMSVIVEKPELFKERYEVFWPWLKRRNDAVRYTIMRVAWLILPFSAVTIISLIVLIFVLWGSKPVRDSQQTGEASVIRPLSVMQATEMTR